VVFLTELAKKALSMYALHDEPGILCLVAIFLFFLLLLLLNKNYNGYKKVLSRYGVAIYN
jgi:hypothetical protein